MNGAAESTTVPRCQPTWHAKPPAQSRRQLVRQTHLRPLRWPFLGPLRCRIGTSCCELLRSITGDTGERDAACPLQRQPGRLRTSISGAVRYGEGRGDTRGEH